MTPARAIPIALALSCAVYLIPIFHIHAGWLSLGTLLAGAREFAPFTLAVFAAALAIQAAIFALIYRLLAAPRWTRLAALAAAVPLAIGGANVLVLYAIPRVLLVEAQPGPETGSLQSACRVADARIVPVQAGSDLALVRAGEIWVERAPDRRRARLLMPGCRVLPADGAPPVGLSIDAVAPGGHLLYRDAGGGQHYVGPAPAAGPQTPPPGLAHWAPILSDDGRALLWLDRAANGSPGAHHIRIRDLDGLADRSVALDLPREAQLTLLGAATRDGPVTLARYRNQIFQIDTRGRVLRGPVSPEGIHDARWGFQWHGDGWIAWDGYRDEGRARIVWSLAAGQGTMTIPRGSGIDDLSLAADGRHFAVATSTNVTIGNVPSAVILVDVARGAELYRRHLPVHNRPTLAFLGARHLAVTVHGDGKSAVEVLAIPAGD